MGKTISVDPGRVRAARAEVVSVLHTVLSYLAVMVWIGALTARLFTQAGRWPRRGLYAPRPGRTPRPAQKPTSAGTPLPARTPRFTRTIRTVLDDPDDLAPPRCKNRSDP